jgi:hypothetical protein
MVSRSRTVPRMRSVWGAGKHLGRPLLAGSRQGVRAPLLAHGVRRPPVVTCAYSSRCVIIGAPIRTLLLRLLRPGP